MHLSSQFDYKPLKSEIVILTFTLSPLVLAMSPAWHAGDAQLTFPYTDEGGHEAWVTLNPSNHHISLGSY